MTDDPIDERIREAARDYNAPPATPRDAIWDGVQRKRSLRPVEGRQRLRLLWIPAAAAALLAVGFLAGRISWPTGASEAPPPVAEERTGIDLQPPRAMLPLQQAAANYLGRTEALLTRYRSDPGAGALRARARELLSETRLLLDSPASQDAELGRLLEDLELLLAQIAYATGDRETREPTFVSDRLERRDILTRLRSRVPSGPAGT